MSCSCEPGVHQEFDAEAATIAAAIPDALAATQRHFSYYWDVSRSDWEDWKLCMSECILVLRRAGWTVSPPQEEKIDPITGHLPLL